jgi:hypothetical protein
MPFKSKAQRRKFAQLLVEGKISNQTFEEWNGETGAKKLPERVVRSTAAPKRPKRNAQDKKPKSASIMRTCRPEPQTLALRPSFSSATSEHGARWTVPFLSGSFLSGAALQQPVRSQQARFARPAELQLLSSSTQFSCIYSNGGNG